MPEMTQNAQLSGDEIIEAVLDKLRTKMRNDCYLNRNSAYDWFSAKVTVQMDMHDTGTLIKADYAIDAASGTPEDDGERVEAELDIPAAPPNVVRVETGQGVPTTTNEGGRQVTKKVLYSRKDAKKASAA